MNFITTLLTLCLSTAAFGKTKYIDTELATCQQEAQIIAKVSAVKKVSQTSCVVQVAEIKQYNVSLICPLEIALLNQGIEVKIKAAPDCTLQVGDVLSGIINKDAAGIIVLE